MWARVGTILLFIAAAWTACAPGPSGASVKPAGDGSFIVRPDKGLGLEFTPPSLAGAPEPRLDITPESEGWTRVRITWTLERPISLDELAVAFRLPEGVDFWWAPHLAPEDGDLVAQHVFRSPALIAAAGKRIMAVVPDLDICGKVESTPWFMDVDAPNRTWLLGLSRTKITAHVQYHRAPGMVLGPGRVELGFYVAVSDDPANPRNPWARAADFLWRKWGQPLLAQGEPTTAPLDAYVRHTYRWAFDTWKAAIWQEFELDGRRVGAPKFIANTTESPNYPGPMDQREFLSIWNQTWFSSLRSASGVARFARRTNDAGLREKAELTKAFALAAPMSDGLFPSVYRTAMETVTVDGVKVQRSKGWQTGYWTNSDRVPRERGLSDRWPHVLDMSWTALLMLRWNEDIEPDPRLVEYAKKYGDRLLSLQDDRGFFPAWLDPETQAPADVLRDSPETALSATFLLKLAAASGECRFRDAALRALDAVLKGPAAEGRWEDYETFWSCSDWGRDRFLGRPVPRNAMFKSNTLSMFWTAEAALEAWRTTKQPRYLAWGRRVLDELSMYQQTWQPPSIYIRALGGFGVMNSDGEWNDSRQTLFCELFMDYYRATGEPAYFERGIAALKAGFVMMYCPENPEVKPLWEKVWPFFNEKDYGFTMENYGHGGTADREGGGIGSFTIYDWGNGAAAEARNRVRDHYGDVFIDRPAGRGFGIDSVAVEIQGRTAVLTDMTGFARAIRIVFEDSTSKEIELAGQATIKLPF